MFLKKFRNIFCVRNKCCVRAQTRKHLRPQQCFRNNGVFPRLRGPLDLAFQTSFERRFMTRATEENENGSRTCILFQFAHVPLVYSGILLDP